MKIVGNTQLGKGVGKRARPFPTDFPACAFRPPYFEIIVKIMSTETPAFKRLLSMPLAALGVLALLAEEFLWDMFVAFWNWVGSLGIMRDAEMYLRTLSPLAAGVALVAPAALIFPVKVLAVYAMASGHFGLGLVVLVSAKIIGTALVARIYTVCEPQLMTMPWFVLIKRLVLDAKNWAHRKLEAWPLYRWMRRAMNRARASFRRFFRGARELG